MKYYFCMALLVSALEGMDAPQISPPGSPQLHSAPNSPGQIRYDRETLLALSKSSLSRSLDAEINLPHEIKLGAELTKAKSDNSTSSKQTSTGNKKRHAKK